jgi:hypothetical protein
MSSSNEVKLVEISNVSFVVVGSGNQVILDRRALIGDWEDGHWGDGKIPASIAAVAAIATLKRGAQMANDEKDRAALNKAADSLTSQLSPQISAFKKSFDAAKVL